MDKFNLCSYCMTRDDFDDRLDELIEQLVNSDNGEAEPLNDCDLFELSCMLEINCTLEREWDIIINDKDKYEYFNESYWYLVKDVDSRLSINREETIDNIIDDECYSMEDILGETYLVR